VITIALLTIREAARRRLLWALLLFTLVLVAITAWGFDAVITSSPLSPVETALGVSQLLILMAFMFSFVLAMTAVFAGSPAIAAGIESGEVLALLARPLRRADIVVGAWLGFAVVVAAYAIAASILEIGAVAFVTGYAPLHPWEAALSVAGEGIVILTFAILLSTRVGVITGGAIGVVVFGINWSMGVMGQAGVVFGNDTLVRVSDLSHVVLPTDILWRGCIAALEPPLATIALGGSQARVFTVSPFYAQSPPGAEQLVLVAVWVVAALGLAVASFARREV
jgi:ABC-type transport system involved in multi-copper enzyme maturation permease subunit